MKITMIGSCFAGFLKNPLTALADSPEYRCIQPIEFQTHTEWQRIDAITDIINNNIPDRHLIEYYIDKGHWDVRSPGKDSEWFAREILARNSKALQLRNDEPDLLIFDSLSDWRHSLYKHKRLGWKCFLGRILFKQPDIEEKFNADFEFIELLALSSVSGCIKTIINYFKTKNNNLRTVYIHFPAISGYLEDKWIKRAAALQEIVSLLKNELSPSEFYQLIVPSDKAIPITDSSHPHYSWQVWNHFHDAAYEYCSRCILEWYAQNPTITDIGANSFSPH